MNWIINFYRKQLVWTNDLVDSNKMIEVEKSRITSLEENSFPIPSNQSILELGPGNGHFAVAAALKGYKVTVVEIVKEACDSIMKLAEEHNVTINVINDDFLKVKLDQQFDIICYWDGFGVGEDKDQTLLLNKISSWLTANGKAFVDIYTPWYWAKVKGIQMDFDQTSRKYNFDAINCRMIDSWWSHEHPEGQVTQTLRCYSPADLKLLSPNLSLIEVQSKGALDQNTGEFISNTELHECMYYQATFQTV
ncbi:class I SAM-dependent methyltransferase [Halalkalibacillus halophilus]|uniref:class I SAM-dependent methyltransferase n=1 Tax=Halalkalibacillus halophilus TaxID=392827 RepID=UPI0004027196|nr:class I SAM-dependent methyltransferase [Halalkalibacillus halophilus]